MKTVVYQSYRRTEVPDWIAHSMRTVRDWAALKGFDYVFIDDRLFDYVPAWYKEKVNGHVQIISDLARLKLARELLSSGYERTIWLDADLVVFDADRFDIPTGEEYIFCREIWIEKLQARRAFHDGLARLGWPRRAQALFRVNNAATVFTKANGMLDFYIHACQLLVRNITGEISGLEAGTLFLTKLYESLRFPLLTNVGLFSPAVMHDIARGREGYVKLYIEAFDSPVFAANLCASYAGKKYNGLAMDEPVYSLVLEKLIKTKGTVVNRHLEPGETESRSAYARRRFQSER